ncbi:uncharacterized protein BJX67DRAFT_51276 [Aspergillus lucknowensis]|uniref:Uncharacterized protein n=1 Tax=Aspergillus lucknowensis TaxID=176173 RepID=A0ABR4LUP3_9EURO
MLTLVTTRGSQTTQADPLEEWRLDSDPSAVLERLRFPQFLTLFAAPSQSARVPKEPAPSFDFRDGPRVESFHLLPFFQSSVSFGLSPPEMVAEPGLVMILSPLFKLAP